MCDNELIRAESKAYCCFISSSTWRWAPLSSPCHLIDIASFAHDSVMLHRAWPLSFCCPCVALCYRWGFKILIVPDYIQMYHWHINQRALFMNGTTLNREDEVSCLLWPILRWAGHSSLIMEISITYTSWELPCLTPNSLTARHGGWKPSYCPAVRQGGITNLENLAPVTCAT